jgi:hypothetical protein
MIRLGRLISFAPLASLALAACSSSDGGGSTYSREQLMDPSTCKECHDKHYSEWSGSMHAYAAKDPVFRAMNARGQRETNGALGDFCVKCHAPMAVLDGKTKDGSNLDSLPEAYQGVTCYFCHQVKDVTASHNNGLVLANDTTMRGGIPDPIKNKAHHAEYSALHDSNDLKSSSLCGSCHDIVVPAHISGGTQDAALERTFQEWQGSIFAQKSNVAATCGSGGCHFNSEYNVPVANYPGVPTRPLRHMHDFPGVDVALTDFPNKEAQRAAVQATLSTSLRVAACGDQLTGYAIEIENVSVGHAVPSGASQDRRLWVEIHAWDTSGQEHSIGVVPRGVPVTQYQAEQDPGMFLFRDIPVDKDGNPTHMFWKVADVPKENRQVLQVPITTDILNPNYHTVGDVFDRPLPGLAFVPLTRYTVTVHMSPIGLEVIDDLIASGDLPPGSGDGRAPDGGGSIRDLIPTFDFTPNGGDVTVEWTPDKVRGPNKYVVLGHPCVETAPIRQ